MEGVQLCDHLFQSRRVQVDLGGLIWSTHYLVNKIRLSLSDAHL